MRLKGFCSSRRSRFRLVKAGRLRLTIMSKGSLGDRGPGCFLLGSSFTHAQVAKAYIERWCRFINL
jgi:hypothetical protein